jgi:hypothetical protein
LNRPVNKAKKNKSEVFLPSILNQNTSLVRIDTSDEVPEPEKSRESVAQEVQSTLNRLKQFFMKNVLMVIIRIFECFWLIVLNLISWPLKWNLMFCQYLLGVVLKGLCCVGCFGCMGCITCGKTYFASI